MTGKHYGHDLFGAAMRGYARRTRLHIRRALDNAHGWSDPHGTKGQEHGGWRLAADVLLTEAKRRGATEEDITRYLERAVETPGEFGDPGAGRSRSIARDEQPYTEDPSKGMSEDDLREYLERIRNPEELRRMVLAERALRVSAQFEAGIE